MKLQFPRQIFVKNTKIPNVTKISPMWAELFNADRQTDGETEKHDEGNSRFPYFLEHALWYQSLP